MELVTSLQTLIEQDYNTFLLVGAREFEVLSIRNKYPKVNVYSKSLSDYEASVNDSTKHDHIAVLFPAKSYLCDKVDKEVSAYMSTEYIGGVA